MSEPRTSQAPGSGSPPLLAAALAYAAAGIPVLPLHTPGPGGRCSCRRAGCERPGKHPRWHPRLITSGLHDASTDPGVLRCWWVTWPDANIGLRTGVVVDVCDVDSDAGLRAVRALLGDDPPPVPAVRTGSGGWHLYLAPVGVGNRVAVLPGVDWRGERGYVVAPPSRHASGRAYHWVQPLLPRPAATGRPTAGPAVDVSACPEPLRRLLVSPPAPEPAPAAAMPPGAAPHRPVRHPDRYVAAALRNEAARVAAARVGERNNTLYRAARRLGELAAAGMVSQARVYAELAPAARAAGLGRPEIARTIASGLLAGGREPRTRAGAPRPDRVTEAAVSV